MAAFTSEHFSLGRALWLWQIVLLVVLCVAANHEKGADQAITMYSCNDTLMCARSTCTTAKFQQGQCLQAGISGSYEFYCAKPDLETLCARAGRYEDTQCKNLSSYDFTVCGTCTMGVATTCNALHVFNRFNCTTPARCGNCTRLKDLPLNKCVPIAPIVDPFIPAPYIKVLSIERCSKLGRNVVHELSYAGMKCGGEPSASLTFPTLSCMNHLGRGFMYDC